MVDLAQQISALENTDAIEAMDYLARWMRDEAQRGGRIPPEILGQIANEQAATQILSEIFPEFSGKLEETLAADQSQRGRIARNYLLFLAEDERYVPKVQEALDRPSTRAEPLTIATVAFGIINFLFVRGLEFEYEYEEVGDTRRKKLRISWKPATHDLIEDLKRILGL